MIPGGYPIVDLPAWFQFFGAGDVLGVDRTGGFSEADIQAAMVRKQPIMVRKGSAVLLVQSGALLADPEGHPIGLYKPASGS